jgi:uncharacterized SAM-binding protein YcdF (DUF218 family)
VLSVLKFVAVPGSLSFLTVCLAFGLGLVYVWPRRGRLGRLFLFTVITAYLLLALPVVANGITGHLPRFESVSPQSAGPLDALVVFDGDNRRGRVRAALDAYASTLPRTVFVLGERWLVDPLVEGGVPKERITWDAGTPTTRDQIAWVSRFMARSPAGRVAVIASRLQMPRVVRLIEAARLRAVLIASPIDTEPPVVGWRVFLPSYTALRVSRDAIYENVALAYYQWRGWL